MAYNPYQVATTNQSILENIIGAKQAQRRGAEEVGQQKSKMQSQFQKEEAAKIKEQEKLASQSRKKKWYEKLAPIISLINPVAGAVIGGLSGMKGIKDTKKFEEEKLAKMKALDIGGEGEYGGTFLGDLASQKADAADTYFEDFQKSLDDIGAGNVLTAGAAGAMKGYGAGKMGQSLGVSDTFFKDLVAGQNPFAGMTSGSYANMEDFLNEMPTKRFTPFQEGGFFKNLFENLGKGGLDSFDPTTMIKEDSPWINSLTKINYLADMFENGGKVKRRNY